MSFVVPIRKERRARLPLFCRVEPLKRPRAHVIRGFAKIYQPKDNQRALLHTVAQLSPLGFDQPVLIDMYINLKKAASSRLMFPTGQRHGDEDNLRKAVNDALVAGGHLTDDSLVLGGQTTKFFANDDVCVVDIWSVHAEPTRYDI